MSKAELLDAQEKELQLAHQDRVMEQTKENESLYLILNGAFMVGCQRKNCQMHRKLPAKDEGMVVRQWQ